jgi:hypothetical protein
METIFVMIPAYSDPVLRETLDSLFDNAEYPNRVYAAVGAQYDEKDPMPSIEGLPMKQIRLLQIHPENRPGTYRLRHILNKLYANEDYYVSVDSHTMFTPGWDTKMINYIESQKEYKVVLQQGTPNDIYNFENGKHFYTYRQLSVANADDTYLGPRLVMKEFIEKDRVGGELPLIHYMQAGMIMTRGQFAREIRWGQYWQNEAEEPFLSYETFMRGWTVRMLDTEELISHQPEKYYAVAYNLDENGNRISLRTDHSVQKDWLPDLSHRIWDLYLTNTGPWAIDHALTKPEKFWEVVGLRDEYLKHTITPGPLP